jgi:hypothetical protein
MNKAIILLVTAILLIFTVFMAGCANPAAEQGNLTPADDESEPGSPTNEDFSAPTEPEPGDEQTPPAQERVETPEANPVTGEVPIDIMEEIFADLVERTGAEEGDIKIIKAEAVVWNDGALGCPKPGEFYIQMMINGYGVVLEVEGVYYDYRVTDSGDFKICEQESLPPITSPDMSDQSQNPLMMQAKEDLAARLGIQTSAIELLEYKEVVWPDSSLGCPQPGMKYLQVPQEGVLIRLGVGREMYFYHSGGDQAPFLCEQLSQIIPSANLKSDELIPPPGSELD